VGTGNVTNLAVSCAAANYTLSGTITGLDVGGLVLANNGATITLSANASDFTFGPVLTVGSAYAVTVQTQPPGLTCSVANGTGIAGAANVTNVVVTCSSLSYTLGGTISGLTAAGLVLANGSDTLTVAANATTFTFDKPVAYSSAYAVGVASQPAGMTCSVANGTGTMPAANVTNVAVTCSTLAFTVSGTISGLTQAGLVLANGADHLTVPANATAFTMPQSVVSGQAYAVTVQTQPVGQTCAVANGSGIMGSGNVTGIVVSCTLQSYTLGGTVIGLTATGLVLANGTDTVAVPPGVSLFTFDKPVAYGSSYDVTVQSQPLLLICVVLNGTGVMAAGNVTNVSVTCAL
jgi:RNase P/RNase MRP subunit p29